MAFTTPALANVKTVNGISAEVNLPNAQRGVPYSAAITPTGGGGAPYAFQFTSGTLPPGYTLSSSGTVSGTNCSATNGSYPFSVRITSSTGVIADFTGSARFSLQMTAGPGAACSLTLAALPTTGTVGTPYSGTASVTGGTAPYTWARTAGTLPPGLTLATGTGVVSGTPTTSGTYAFTLRVTDSTGASGTSNYTITIAPVITVNPATLPNGLQNIAYSQAVSGSGGTAPYTFSVSAGTLPTGLSLSPTGTLSGTPTVPGTNNFTVRATDANGFSGTGSYTVVVTAAPTITVSPASVPDGLQNKPYATQTIVASGGTSPYVYGISSGALPAGLTLSSGGALSGTPTASGSFTFTVTATDANGYTANRVYSMTVAAQPTIVVSPTTLTTALQNLPYAQTISASGGTASYTFAVASGTLPAGLALAGDGTLSGTPTASGSFDFTVTATDANTYTGQRAYTLSVTAAPTIVVSPAWLPTALQSQPYSQTITGSGGTGPYAFTVVGSLPAGITLAPSGLLSGTPSVSGAFDFSIQAADANGYLGTRAYTLNITAAPTITLSPVALPDALEHLPYGPLTITASGGTAPYAYGVTSGTLPAGLSISSGGVLSGTANEPGTFTFTVTAKDASNYTGSRAYTLTVIEAPTISLSPVSLPGALENRAYGPQAVTATGGTAPYTYAVTGGSLPSGVTLSAAGSLAGTPTENGTFNFTITATDANAYTGSRSYSLDVTPEPTISVSPITLPDAFQSQVYAAQNIVASGGTAPYSYAVTGGALPAGLTLSSGGVLSGTPTANGSFTFATTATDANGYSGSRVYTLGVTAQPTITVSPAGLPGAFQNQVYSQNIVASGGTAPYSYAVTGGALPAGLALATDGTLSGTPSVSGTFNFTVTATDANNYTASHAYALGVTAQPTITVSPAGLPGAFQNQVYSQNIVASGGTAPYSYAITGGALPAGLTLAGDGTLSGTPSVSGTFNFTVTATDANDYVGARAYTLGVAAAPTITVNPASLSAGLQGIAYGPVNLTAIGGTGPYAFDVSSGELPVGLTLSSAGVLSGTPTSSGAFNVTITATDAGNYTGSRAYTLSVTPASTIGVAPPTLPSAKQALSYSQSITASGGTGPYTFGVTAGVLPAGLTLSTGGALSGTPSVGGTFDFTVTATDSVGFSGTQAYSLDVSAQPAITLGPASLPGALQDQSYPSQTITAMGGTAPHTFAVTGGALPSGLSLAADGTLSGTPTAWGTFNFTVTATDADGYTGSHGFSIVVTAAPTITVNPASVPGGLQNQPYATQSIVASGGTAPYTFAVTGGALPSGLTLTADGTLSGTPTASGTFNVTITATDANDYAGNRAYSIVVTAAPTITINPATLPAALQNQAYGPQALAATGGTGPFSFAVTGGSLPAGLALAADGTLSGTPTGSGTFNFTAMVTDSNGYTGSRTYSLSVTSAPTITLAPLTLPTALEDRPYASQNVTASGGTAPYTYAIATGSLPSGMTFSSSGVLSGTPGVAGVFTFTVTATDANGYEGSIAYTLDVTAQPDISLSPVSLPVALENKLYAPQQITASGGTAPYTYAVTSGALPAAVTLSGAGVLSGTPTESGAFNFTLTATDANGYTANRSYTLDVTSQPVITLSPVTLPTAQQNQAYGPQSISAAGGTAPYAYAITGGALPAGIGFSSGGGLTGTSTVSGTFTFTVTATDANGYTGSLQYELDVTAAPTILISPASLPAVLQNQPYSQTIAASGGTPAYTYAVTGGALPAGLALASGGALTGTPTAAGTFNFTVTATDANGYTASQVFTLTVNAPLQAVAADPVPPITAGGAITPFIPVTASGGTAPYTYSISPGLPAGMTFDPATGQIAGTPTQSQPLTTYTVTIQDASGESATQTFDLQVLVYTVSFTPASADLGRAGLPVDLTFVAAGGFAPYVFLLESGVLPGGLSLSLAGHLTGRTAQAGTYPVQLRVTDANGVTAVQAVTFTVGEPRPDPTLDAGVQALQTAQAESIRRFGRAQTGNAVRRLEQLRGCAAPDNQLNVQVGNQGSVPVGQLTEDAKKPNCEQQSSAWVAGTVVLTDGVDGGDNLTTDGVTVGMDFRVSDTLRLGAGIGYSRQGESRLAGDAKLSGDGYNALAYGSWKLQPQIYLEGLVGYGNASYDISRLIAEEDARATASRDASHWFGSLGIAANLVLAKTFLQPYLRADYQAASFDAYREHSVSSLALRYDSLDSDTMDYTGGVRANWSIATSFGSFDPMLRLEYNSESCSSLHQHLEYADGLDGIDYTLKNGSGNDASGLVGAGFGLRFLSGFSAELEYQTTFGSDRPDDQSIGAIVNWAF